MMDVHFWSSQTSLFIIVLVWYFKTRIQFLSLIEIWGSSEDAQIDQVPTRHHPTMYVTPVVFIHELNPNFETDNLTDEVEEVEWCRDETRVHIPISMI